MATPKITHSYVSANGDPPDPTLIGQTKWNADHAIALSTNNVIVGRKTTGAGDAEELTASDVAGLISGEFAAVALSGDYDDLTNKPTLGTAAPLDIDTDGTLAANSDSKIASQKAVKTYALKSLSSSTDDAIVRFDGTGGKTVQNSSVKIDDSDRMKFGPDAVNVVRTNPGIDIAHKTITTSGISLIELLGYANTNTVLQTNELVVFNNTSAATDVGPFRAVARHIGSNDGRADSTEGAQIRSAEFHVVRGQGVPIGTTWCMELGMHRASADAITHPSQYAAIFARSSVSGWVNGTGQRGGYVLYADGSVGWNGLAFMYDTDGSTVLYDLDQNGVIKSKGGIQPTVSDGAAIGSASLPFSDAFLASGGVMDWANGDVTITHSTNALAFAGASSGYSFDAAIKRDANFSLDFSSSNPLIMFDSGDGIIYDRTNNAVYFNISSATEVVLSASALSPGTNDGNALGTASKSWADLFLASGGVLNWGNGGYTLTQASNVLTAAASSAPEFRVAEGGSTSSYLSIADATATQTIIQKVSASGQALIDIAPIPSDGTSQALFRFFRTTNTSGGAVFSVYLGNNTATINSQIGGTGDSYLNQNNGNVGIGTNSPSVKFDVNSDNLRLRTAKTPASASATGTQGQICWDSNYLYVCVATNTWKRAAIATW